MDPSASLINTLHNLTDSAGIIKETNSEGKFQLKGVSSWKMFVENIKGFFSDTIVGNLCGWKDKRATIEDIKEYILFNENNINENNETINQLIIRLAQKTGIIKKEKTRKKENQINESINNKAKKILNSLKIDSIPRNQVLNKKTYNKRSSVPPPLSIKTKEIFSDTFADSEINLLQRGMEDAALLENFIEVPNSFDNLEKMEEESQAFKKLLLKEKPSISPKLENVYLIDNEGSQIEGSKPSLILKIHWDGENTITEIPKKKRRVKSTNIVQISPGLKPGTIIITQNVPISQRIERISKLALQAFKALKNSPTTQVLLGVCLTTHVFSYLSYPTGLYMGAFNLPKILQGEVWRLATSEILHANLLHLALNMQGLLIKGPKIEKEWGTYGFAQISAMSIVAKVLMNVATGNNGYSVGLSGMLYGMDGALLAKSLKEKKQEVSELLKNAAMLTCTEYLFMVAVNYLTGIKVSFIGHITGYAAGMVFGWFSK
jgi:membrane associated rhomboid family serine protease